jgi:uncharacterized protein YraI
LKFLVKSRHSRLPKLALIILAALAAGTAASTAEAYQAFVSAPAPLRAGPAGNFPPIVGLLPGQPVEVYGCLPGYQWCDIAIGPDRGWFNGARLDFPYQGRREPVVGFGVQFGVPVVAFSFDDYWGRYYRDRSFYSERDHWAHFVPPGHRWDHHHRHDDDDDDGDDDDHGHGHGRGHDKD